MSASPESLSLIEYRTYQVFNKEPKQDRYSSKKLLDIAFPRVPCAEAKHVAVKGAKSPFDGDLIYWSKRNSKLYDGPTSKALKKQNHACALCSLKLLTDEKVHLHHIDGNHDNWRTDAFLSLGGDRIRPATKLRLSYLVYREGVMPQWVLEVVSQTPGGEYDKTGTKYPAPNDVLSQERILRKREQLMRIEMEKALEQEERSRILAEQALEQERILSANNLEQERRSIALNLLGQGIPVETIAQATGLTIAQVQSFQGEL